MLGNFHVIFISLQTCLGNLIARKCMYRDNMDQDACAHSRYVCVTKNVGMLVGIFIRCESLRITHGLLNREPGYKTTSITTIALVHILYLVSLG